MTMAERVQQSIRLARWARKRGPLRSVQPLATIRTMIDVGRFIHDWRVYSRLPGAERLTLDESWPCISDRSTATPFDPQYFHQSIWAGKLIAQRSPALHVDIGSDHRMVGMLSCFASVVFVDIRPLEVSVEGLSCLAGSILNIPFMTDSLPSLSCLHVAEHIGLGRYGDALDPFGTRRAASELCRVLRQGGDLYFSAPIGRGRVQFNGQRVHSPITLLEYFARLDLIEFSAVDDNGRFRKHADPKNYLGAERSCGFFWFHKREEGSR